MFTIAFTIWMMNGYFRSIPKEIEEAALIDGCSRVQTITRIMLPIAVPGLVTAMIYSFIFSWNEFLFGLTFIQSKEKMPLVIGLYKFVGRWTTQWELLERGGFPGAHPRAGAVLPHREAPGGRAGRRRGQGLRGFSAAAPGPSR